MLSFTSTVHYFVREAVQLNKVERFYRSIQKLIERI